MPADIVPDVTAVQGLSTSLAWATILALLIPIAISPTRGVGRLLTPTGTCAIVLLLIFGARPLALMHWGLPLLYGQEVGAGQHFAQHIGAIASTCFVAGVLLGHIRPSRSTLLPNAKREQRLASVTLIGSMRVAIISVIFAAGIVLVKAGPSGLQALSGGRSDQTASVLDGLPTVILVLPLAGSVAATMYICTAAPRGRLTRPAISMLLVLVLVSALANVGLGNRRFVIPSILIPLAAVVFSRGGKLPKAFIPVLPTSLIVLAVLPLVRTAGSRKPGQSLVGAVWDTFVQQGLGSTFRTLLTVHDTEMFSYIAMVGPNLDQTGYGMGRGTILEALQYPVPSSITGPGYSDHVLQQYFGTTCAGVCPEASLPGTLLFDFATIGVILGMFLLGFLLRRMEARMIRSASPGTIYSLALIAGFAPVIMRTNSSIAIWWLAYTAATGWLIQRYLSRRPAPTSNHDLAEAVRPLAHAGG